MQLAQLRRLLESIENDHSSLLQRAQDPSTSPEELAKLFDNHANDYNVSHFDKRHIHKEIAKNPNAALSTITSIANEVHKLAPHEVGEIFQNPSWDLHTLEDPNLSEGDPKGLIYLFKHPDLSSSLRQVGLQSSNPDILYGLAQNPTLTEDEVRHLYDKTMPMKSTMGIILAHPNLPRDILNQYRTGLFNSPALSNPRISRQELLNYVQNQHDGDWSEISMGEQLKLLKNPNLSISEIYNLSRHKRNGFLVTAQKALRHPKVKEFGQANFMKQLAPMDDHHKISLLYDFSLHPEAQPDFLEHAIENYPEKSHSHPSRQTFLFDRRSHPNITPELKARIQQELKFKI